MICADFHSNADIHIISTILTPLCISVLLIILYFAKGCLGVPCLLLLLIILLIICQIIWPNSCHI
jgi:hypothetical protein